MKAPLKNFLFLLSFIPLFLKVPYLLASWRGSIFERNDAFIWLIIPFVALACELIRRCTVIVGGVKNHYRAFSSVMIILLLMFFAFGFSLNALGFALAVIIIFVAIELCFGSKVFLSQIPTLLFALTTIPNLSFWANYYLDLSVGTILSFFISKLTICFIFFALWVFHALYFKRYPRFLSVAFCAFVGLSISYSLMRTRSIESGEAIALNTDVLTLDEWLGAKLPMANLDKQLFSNADEVERIIYYSNTSYVSLLAISSSDKTKIHPAEICIKSTGETVLASRQIYLNIASKKIQANEIIFTSAGKKFVEYSIFSNGKISTGFFTKFRLANDADKWIHYQISTPLLTSEIATRTKIENFLSTFVKAN